MSAKQPTQMRVKVTKLEAARRQLETAIIAYFNGGDPVSIHTLATSAREVLSNLNAHRGGKPMFFDLEAIKPEHRKDLRKKFREAQNFFKHADNDPDGVLDFNPESSVTFIFDAVEKYIELSCENPPVLRVFSLWFRAECSHVFHFTAEEAGYFADIRKHYTHRNRSRFFAEFLPMFIAAALKKPGD